MRNETKNAAIKRLKEEGYGKLYVVDCYITDQIRNVSTWLWNIYPNMADAMRWVNLCERFHKATSKKYTDVTEQNGDDYLLAYEYAGGWSDDHILTKFKLTVV